MNDRSIPRWRGYAALTVVVGFGLCLWVGFVGSLVGAGLRSAWAWLRPRHRTRPSLPAVSLWEGNDWLAGESPATTARRCGVDEMQIESPELWAEFSGRRVSK